MLYLFDIDGTLLLAGGAGSAAINRVFADRYGLPDAMADIRPAGKTDPLIITEIFVDRLGRDPASGEVEAVLAEYVPYLAEELPRTPRFRMMPSVIECLDFLAARDDAVLGLATGNIKDGARLKLERLGLWQRFVVGGFGDDAAERTALVRCAIDRASDHLGRPLGGDEIVIVGDTPRDVVAARACGVLAIAVATGPIGADQLAASRPDALFTTLAELPAWHAARHDGAGFRAAE